MWFIELVGGCFLVSCLFAGVKRTMGLGKDVVNKFYDWVEEKLHKN